jgi:hypothetical protein
MPVVALADVAWVNSNGAAENFTWTNGHNTDSNLFGSPSWYGGDNLYFLDSSFVAYADDVDTHGTVTDTLNVDLHANPTLKFFSISIYEYGDYTIGGGNGNSVSADLDMAGSVPGHPQSPWMDDFLLSTSGAGSASWNTGDPSPTLMMEFAVPDVTSVHLEVSNTLVAMSDGQGGTASITGNFVLLGISVTLIPEPTTLALLAAGSLLVTKRRR